LRFRVCSTVCVKGIARRGGCCWNGRVSGCASWRGGYCTARFRRWPAATSWIASSQGERRRAQREVLGLSEADSEGAATSAASTACEPARLALWTEFHERVATLSEPERAVFEMHYYLELPQAEIAQVLELHPRKVSYLWIAATEKLGEGLDAAL